jgi:hypothetical protein
VPQNKQISKRTEPKKGSKMDLKNGSKNPAKEIWLKSRPKGQKTPEMVSQRRSIYLYRVANLQLTTSFNFILVRKCPQCERSEPLFPNNHFLNFLLFSNFHPLPQ